MRQINILSYFVAKKKKFRGPRIKNDLKKIKDPLFIVKGVPIVFSNLNGE